MKRRIPGLAAIGLVGIALVGIAGCDIAGAARARAAAAALQQAAKKAEAEARANAARAKGTADATADVKQGTLKLKEYPPLPTPAWHGKYVELLKTECDVAWEVVQGPPDSPDLIAEVSAYNEVQSAEIQRRFGADIFTKLLAIAEEK